MHLTAHPDSDTVAEQASGSIGSRTRSSGGSTAECAVRPKSAVSGSTTPAVRGTSMSPSAADTSTPESDAARGLSAIGEPTRPRLPLTWLEAAGPEARHSTIFNLSCKPWEEHSSLPASVGPVLVGEAREPCQLRTEALGQPHR